MAKILLVDDMLDLLEEEAEMLEECGLGYEVKGTASPEDALKMMEGGGFDLIILDVKMPKIDGLEVLRWVKARYQIPIIIYSAYIEEEMSRQLFQAGADIVLTKPAPPDLFLNAVMGLLEQETKTSVVIVDGYRIERIHNGVLERRVQEALAQSQGAVSHAASSLQISQEYLLFLLKKFHLAG